MACSIFLLWTNSAQAQSGDLATVYWSLLAASLCPVQLDVLLVVISRVATAVLLAIHLMRTLFASSVTVTGVFTAALDTGLRKEAEMPASILSFQKAFKC